MPIRGVAGALPGRSCAVRRVAERSGAERSRAAGRPELLMPRGRAAAYLLPAGLGLRHDPLLLRQRRHLAGNHRSAVSTERDRPRDARSGSSSRPYPAVPRLPAALSKLFPAGSRGAVRSLPAALRRRSGARSPLPSRRHLRLLPVLRSARRPFGTDPNRFFLCGRFKLRLWEGLIGEMSDVGRR